MKTALLVTVAALLTACGPSAEEKVLKQIFAKCKREVSVSLATAWYATTVTVRCDDIEFDKNVVRQ
jgi:hypothetical protein